MGYSVHWDNLGSSGNIILCHYAYTTLLFGVRKDQPRIALRMDGAGSWELAGRRFLWSWLFGLCDYVSDSLLGMI